MCLMKDQGHWKISFKTNNDRLIYRERERELIFNEILVFPIYILSLT